MKKYIFLILVLLANLNLKAESTFTLLSVTRISDDKSALQSINVSISFRDSIVIKEIDEETGLPVDKTVQITEKYFRSFPASAELTLKADIENWASEQKKLFDSMISNKQKHVLKVEESVDPVTVGVDPAKIIVKP